MNRLVWLAITCTTFATAQRTDQSVSLSKVERKNRAPVSKGVLRVKFPRQVEAKLDNGLSVLVLEDHRFPTVSVELMLEGAGGLFDPPDRPGLAALTAAMMLEGTDTLNSRQVSESIDDLGASLVFTSGFGVSEALMKASGLSENFDEWFGIAMNVLRTANFSDGELQKLKRRDVIRLRQQRGQAAFLANERFLKAIYGDYPAAAVSATPASIGAVTSEELKRWRDERYAPQNSILAIAGDVNAKQLIPKLSAATADWRKTDFRFALPPAPQSPAEKKVYIVDMPKAVRTNLAMGNLAMDRVDADVAAYTVLNRVLGGGVGGMSSSSFNRRDFIGPWVATSEVRTAVTDGATTELLKEFIRMREDKVPAGELQDAERSIVAEFALSLEQPAQLLNYAVIRKRFGLPDDYWDTYPARISAVTSEDIQRVAKKYLSLSNLQIVAVGDAAAIRTVMEKYGPVSLYSSDGIAVHQ